MTNNFQIEEEENIEDILNRENVYVNDTIEIITNNQEGYKKFKIVLDEHQCKNIKLISDIYGVIDNFEIQTSDDN